KTEFEATTFGSSDEKLAAIPINKKKPIKQKTKKANKLAKKETKKFFMLRYLIV
ncbi:MAG: hypothetical protein RLZZ196_2360, partial [Bacteroidota bacterium]